MKPTGNAVLVALSLGFTTVVFDATALSIALPAVGASLGGSLPGLQWVINSYVLAFASFLLLTGRLGDRLGARRTLVLGTAAFSAASLACAAAPSLGFMLAARFVQGTCAAVVVTSSYAMVAHVFPARRERAKALATLNLCGTVGLTSGPLVAGVLIEHGSWRWIFAPNVLIAGLIIVGVRRVANPAAQRGMALDLGGQILSVLALGGLAACLIEGRALGWRHPVVVVSAVIFASATTAFVAVERRHPAPMLPLSLFRVVSFSTTSLGGGMWRFSLYGLMFFLSLYFQTALHYSSGAAGLAFLPLTAAPLISNPASAPGIRRLGCRRMASGGFALAAVGVALLVTVHTSSPYWITGIALGLMGLGGGFAMPALGVASLHAVPTTMLGVASGVFNSGGQTGLLMGVAVIGSLPARDGTSSLHTAAIIAATVLSVGAVLIATTVQGGHKEPTGSPS